MTRAEEILVSNGIEEFDRSFLVDKNLLAKYYHGDPYYNINMEPWVYFGNKGKFYIFDTYDKTVQEITKVTYLTVKKDYDDAWEWYQTW